MDNLKLQALISVKEHLDSKKATCSDNRGSCPSRYCSDWDHMDCEELFIDICVLHEKGDVCQPIICPCNAEYDGIIDKGVAYARLAEAIEEMGG